MLDFNQALTWIVFDRGEVRFARNFPGLRLEQRRYLPWFSYLLSGSVNLRTFFPCFLTPVVAASDSVLKPLDPLRHTLAHDYLQECRMTTIDEAR